MLKQAVAGLCAAALLGLSGCGELNKESPAAGLARVAKERFAGRSEAPAAPAPALTRAAADANPGAFRIMSLAGQGQEATLVPAGVNGTRVTWLSADQVSITLENGLLVATRGFAQDLMAADVSGVMQALITSGGEATRRIEFLNGIDQISTEVLQCSIASAGNETLTILEKSVPTERFNEDCASDSLRFTNIYWISDDGVIVKSHQLISQGVGFLQIIAP